MRGFLVEAVPGTPGGREDRGTKGGSLGTGRACVGRSVGDSLGVPLLARGVFSGQRRNGSCSGRCRASERAREMMRTASLPPLSIVSPIRRCQAGLAVCLSGRDPDSGLVWSEEEVEPVITVEGTVLFRGGSGGRGPWPRWERRKREGRRPRGGWTAES